MDNIYFNRRPVSQSIDYRPLWKIGQILLVIRDGSSASGCSLLKIHLFSWVFQKYKNKQRLRMWVNNDFESDIGVWTLSPHVTRAIDFAIGELLIEEQKGKYKLTKKGESFLKKIDLVEEAYQSEKRTLLQYGKLISDAKIDKLAKSWKR